jgi:hypothetical protein
LSFVANPTVADHRDVEETAGSVLPVAPLKRRIAAEEAAGSVLPVAPLKRRIAAEETAGSVLPVAPSKRRIAAEETARRRRGFRVTGRRRRR